MSDPKLPIDIRDPQAINAIGRTVTEILSGFAADIHKCGEAYAEHLKPENADAVSAIGCVAPLFKVGISIDFDYNTGTVKVTGSMAKPYMRPVFVNTTVTRKAIDNTPGK